MGISIMFGAALNCALSVVLTLIAISDIAICVTAISNGISIPSATAGAISMCPYIPCTGAGLAGFFQVSVGALGTYEYVVGSLHDGTHWPMVTTMVGSGAIAFLFVLLGLKAGDESAD